MYNTDLVQGKPSHHKPSPDANTGSAIPRTTANIIINLLTHAPSDRPIMLMFSDKLTWIHWQYPRGRFMFLYRCSQAKPQLLPRHPRITRATPESSYAKDQRKDKDK